MSSYYRAKFEKQNTGSALAWSNCAAASAAMLADQSTLGMKDPTPDRIRKLTKDFEGGLTMSQVGSALDRIGIHTTVYDGSDGYTWRKMHEDLLEGRFMVVAGDYDVIPVELRGDKDYGGFHAVFFHEVDDGHVIVGDPLNDGRREDIPRGYLRWPIEVAKAYVQAVNNQIPGDSLHACVMDLRLLTHRSNRRGCNIRRLPDRASPITGRIANGEDAVWGGTVKGQMVNGSDVWYKVWNVDANRIGYAHSAVVVTL